MDWVDAAVSTRHQPRLHGGMAPTAHLGHPWCCRLLHRVPRSSARGRSAASRIHTTAGSRRLLQTIGRRQSLALRQHTDVGLRFVNDLELLLTNNVAERSTRTPKVKQKNLWCFRTFASAEHSRFIHSCLDTLRKQGRSMLTIL